MSKISQSSSKGTIVGRLFILTAVVVVLSVVIIRAADFSRLAGTTSINSGLLLSTPVDNSAGLRLEFGKKERLSTHGEFDLQVGRVISVSSRALVEAAGDISIYDISSIASPQFRGRIRRTGKLLELVGASANYVYLSESTPPDMSTSLGEHQVDRDNLLVYDISSPSNPVQRSTLSLAEGTTDLYYSAERVVYTFSGATNAGLKVIDVSDPDSPQELGQLTLRSPRQIAVAASKAYVADKNSSGEPILETVAISNPAQMDVVDTQSIEEMPAEMHVDQDLFIMDSSVRMLQLDGQGVPTNSRVIDLPYNPVSPLADGVPDFITREPARRMVPTAFSASADKLFIASTRAVTTETPTGDLDGRTQFDSRPAIVVFSVSNPSVPTLLGIVDRSSNIMAIGGVQNGLLLAQEDGLHIVSAEDVEDVVELSGPEETRGWVQDIATSGNLVLVADHYSGLRIISISSVVSPTQLALVQELAGKAYFVETQGDYAYVLSKEGELTVVDVSNPSSPSIEAQINLSSEADYLVVPEAITSTASHLFVVDRTGVILISIINPTSPAYVSRFGSFGRFVDIVGSTLIVADTDERVAFYDITVPEDHTLLNSIEVEVLVGAMAMGSTYGYFPSMLGGISAIDLSGSVKGVATPSSTQHYMPSSAAFREDRVYAGSLNAGLHTYNVSDPENPSLVVNATVAVPARIYDLDIHDSILVAAGGDSLYLFDVSDADNPELVTTIPFPG